MARKFRLDVWLMASGMLAAALLACADAAVSLTDDTGAQVRLSEPAQRIASLSPGATEMLFAAGAGAKVVATVEYSVEPAAARRVPRIGDAMAVDIEKLVALHPDVAIIWPRGGNAAQNEKIGRLGIPLYRQEVDRLSDLAGSLRRLGALAGTEAVAERNARRIEERLVRLKQEYAGKRTLTVLLQVWNRPIYTVGGTQFMSDALRMCGARNVFEDLTAPGPAVDIESVIARNPDVIVAVAPRGSAAAWLAAWKRFPALRAVSSRHLLALEDDRFSRPGPSALAATEDLCKRLAQLR